MEEQATSTNELPAPTEENVAQTDQQAEQPTEAQSPPESQPQVIPFEIENCRPFKRSLVGHGSSVWGVAISPDCKYIVTGSYDQRGIIWDFETGKLYKELKLHSDYIGACLFIPDGRIVLASEDASFSVWDTQGHLLSHVQGVEERKKDEDKKEDQKEEEKKKEEGHKGGVRALSASLDSKFLATASVDSTVM